MVEMRLLSECRELLKNFDCENEVINNYFTSKAQDDSDAVSFAFIDEEKEALIALSSLSCSSIIAPSGNKLHLLPAVEIKMFAVNKEYQHKPVFPEDDQHWSSHCLDKIIFHIREFTDTHCGASRIVLYSVPKAESFYLRAGFKKFLEFMRPQDKSFLEDCIPMFMVL